ncbi:MAG: hypothetical protein ACPW61_12820 [Methyloligella sp. ZOD6]
MERTAQEPEAVHGLQASGASEAFGYSLLRLSLAGRLGVAALAIAVLWAGVFWALS